MKLLIVLITLHFQTNLFAFEVHAHRGGSSQYAENSLNAIIESLDKGVYAAELDIHLTKDNQFVISHDPVISPKKCESPIQGKLKTLVIRELLLSEVITFKCKTGGLAPEPIASLEELLIQTEKFKNQKLNIELKYYNKTTKIIYTETHKRLYPSLIILSDELNRLLVKYNAYKRVIIQSFSKNFLILIKSISSDVVTSYLYKGAYLRVVPEKVIKKYNIRKYLWVPSFRRAFNTMKKENFDYFSPTIGQITNPVYKKQFRKNVLEARSKEGLTFKIIPWTVNSTEALEDYKDEFDGVITDIPELFM